MLDLLPTHLGHLFVTRRSHFTSWGHRWVCLAVYTCASYSLSCSLSLHHGRGDLSFMDVWKRLSARVDRTESTRTERFKDHALLCKRKSPVLPLRLNPSISNTIDLRVTSTSGGKIVATSNHQINQTRNLSSYPCLPQT